MSATREEINAYMRLYQRRRRAKMTFEERQAEAAKYKDYQREYQKMYAQTHKEQLKQRHKQRRDQAKKVTIPKGNSFVIVVNNGKTIYEASTREAAQRIVDRIEEINIKIIARE